jgi:transcriptional regulator with GAF, ATPase, and Fis domain/tetratricopeptide (TPR) repeat protein
VEQRVGEGVSGTVWRARSKATGQLAALKVIRNSEADALREASILARAQRRWGPRLLDVGVVPEGVRELPVGARFVATTWADGTPLDPLSSTAADPADLRRLAAVLAHGVGRALAELHELGVRHGDVKPANVLVDARALRGSDRALERGCTLIDLGLAAAMGTERVWGATPRYMAPELRRSLEEAGPEADLYAFGLMLAEVLDPGVARSRDPRAAMREWGATTPGPAEWAEALVAESAGGRPSALWVAAQASRWLGLQRDPAEDGEARVAQVARTYLRARSRELSGGRPIAPEVDGLPRAWLEEALTWAGKLAPAIDTDAHPPEPLRVMSPLARARWLVLLVGPIAASWPLTLDLGDDEELAQRLVAFARERPAQAWTLDDVRARQARQAPEGPASRSGGRDAGGPGVAGPSPPERAARLARELARPLPDARVLARAEEELLARSVPSELALDLSSALMRQGELGRAWVALTGLKGAAADTLRAEVARRRGDVAEATRAAARAADSDDDETRATARAILARIAWDAGDLVQAEEHLAGVRGPRVAEVRALIDYRRGDLDAGLRAVRLALTETRDPEACARLEATRGMLEHARGDADASLAAFSRAVELATRNGGVIEEATYLTGEAAAAADAGDLARALAGATRAALLWERLGRRGLAARAWLSRATALATVGAVHAADEAADESRARALESGDGKAAVYARWASVQAREPGDPRARAEAVLADSELSAMVSRQDASAGASPGDVEDGVRSAARLLVWAPDAINDARVQTLDASADHVSVPARWEWWGARAASIARGRRAGVSPQQVLASLLSLADARAPLESRGPALFAGARLATELGDGDASRRLEVARRAAARKLREGTPPALRAGLAAVAWAHEGPADPGDVALAPGQIAQLESIVRALGSRDRLRPLLDQVLDTMVLWSGVERGLLLLKAPDDRLVVRAARNLARHDLKGEQLALSQGIARRAFDSGEAIVATDAFASLGDLHASVHALKLRSVLAVPLIARGESLGVVYLDDRARKGAFGPAELAWVRLVASQAATAIADARDQVLLKRAVRRAERAKGQLEALLRERDAELDATRAELLLTRDGAETRYKYDAIAGRSEAMRTMLGLLDRVTASDVPVLLVGESGTGKELVARALHANGPRSRRAFVSENCASVPETLLETTLFGHVKGAFTGASSTRAGLFDIADGGTLLLDEIGEMSLGMQAKLLRVLQDGEVRPVGGDRTRKVDVRIIGATHRDLEAMVSAGTFREDLFYRLNVITVRIPALRERPEDVPLLAAHFADKHAPGRNIRFTRAAMGKLMAYPWPGNVRQLENEVRRALVLASDQAKDGRIDVVELSADVARGGPSAARGAGLGLRSRVDALEAELVRDALEKTRGNQTKAAQALGLSRFGLQKMIKRLKIETGSR